MNKEFSSRDRKIMLVVVVLSALAIALSSFVFGAIWALPASAQIELGNLELVSMSPTAGETGATFNVSSTFPTTVTVQVHLYRNGQFSSWADREIAPGDSSFIQEFTPGYLDVLVSMEGVVDALNQVAESNELDSDNKFRWPPPATATPMSTVTPTATQTATATDVPSMATPTATQTATATDVPSTATPTATPTPAPWWEIDVERSSQGWDTLFVSGQSLNVHLYLWPTPGFVQNCQLELAFCRATSCGCMLDVPPGVGQIEVVIDPDNATGQKEVVKLDYQDHKILRKLYLPQISNP